MRGENSARAENDIQANKNVGSTKVVNKKKRKKPKVRIRPVAIVIFSKENLSYAEILKKIKGNLGPRDLGGNISKIRGTQKGDLMFQLKKIGHKKN